MHAAASRQVNEYSDVKRKKKTDQADLQGGIEHDKRGRYAT